MLAASLAPLYHSESQSSLAGGEKQATLVCPLCGKYKIYQPNNRIDLTKIEENPITSNGGFVAMCFPNEKHEYHDTLNEAWTEGLEKAGLLSCQSR